MNDTQFITQFEQAHLPQFTHRDHIRMAWIYLRDRGWDEACTSIRSGLKHFALAHNQANKYHETITMFWIDRVYLHLQESPDLADFDSFAQRYPQLFEASLLARHYSREILASAEARTTYVEADLLPMH